MAQPVPRAVRRRWLVPLGLAALAALLAFAAGPRARARAPAPGSAPPLPADLDAYLAGSEAGVGGLRPELAKGIQWADPATRARTRLALVFLHGFSASRKELSPLLEELGASLSANVFFARLRGHGQDAEALGRARADDWLADADEALAIGRRLGERVVVVGASTGGTLATWLASRAPDLHALVLLAPNFGLKDRASRVLLLPWGDKLARLALGPNRSFKPASALQERRWTTSYPVEALPQMMAVVRLVDGIDLGGVQVPALVLYTERDEVLDTGRIRDRFQSLGSPTKELVPIAGAGHVLCGDAVNPGTTPLVKQHILAFLGKLAR